MNITEKFKMLEALVEGATSTKENRIAINLPKEGFKELVNQANEAYNSASDDVKSFDFLMEDLDGKLTVMIGVSNHEYGVVGEVMDNKDKFSDKAFDTEVKSDLAKLLEEILGDITEEEKTQIKKELSADLKEKVEETFNEAISQVDDIIPEEHINYLNKAKENLKVIKMLMKEPKEMRDAFVPKTKLFHVSFVKNLSQLMYSDTLNTEQMLGIRKVIDTELDILSELNK